MEVRDLKVQFNLDTRLKQPSLLLVMEQNADTSKLLIAQKSQKYIPLLQNEMFVQLVQKGLLAPIPTSPWRLPYPA